jgi:hypothetical protein
MQFVMGGVAGIREYDWRFLTDMKNWFQSNRSNFPKKYPFDVINFHHYNSNRWFGVGGSGTVSLVDYAASPEEDRWNIGSTQVNYSAATTEQGIGIPQEGAITGLDVVNPIGSTYRTFKQRLVELRYRVDTLFSGNNIELWMSEFGFDTNEQSPYKAPTIRGNGTVADQQEVQARFIMRGYLEIAAAKWDRAMQFNLCDKQSSDGIIFDASGLLQDRAHRFAPKKSYYYVHTMKEALKGTKFTKEIKVADDPTFTTTGLFQGHSYWYKDAKYPRISRFAAANPNATRLGEIVYVTWLPTKVNADTLNVKIYLDATDNAATKATLVECAVGDINGVRKGLAVLSEGSRKYVLVPKITEVPLFIRLGDSITDSQVEKPVIDRGNTIGISCDAIRVKLTTAVPTNGFLRVYYYEKPLTEWTNSIIPFNRSDRSIKFYADSIKTNDFILSNLKLAHNKYAVYVQAVDSNGNVSEFNDFTTVETIAGFNNHIAVSQMRSDSTKILKQLFDYGNLDFCYPLRTQKAPDGNYTYDYLGQWSSFRADDTIYVRLVSSAGTTLHYYLDAVSVLGGTGAGIFRIEYWDAASSTYKPWVQYLKDGFDEWRTFVGLTVPVAQLRLIKEKGMGIRKIILKGRYSRDWFDVADCGWNLQEELITTRLFGYSPLTDITATAFTQHSFSGILLLNGTLIIDKDYSFKNAKIYMEGANTAIIVQSGKTLTMDSTNVRGGRSLHKGIIVEPGGKLIISNSQIRDAKEGIWAQTSHLPTLLKLANTVFEENLTGLTVREPGGQIDPNSLILGCSFDGNFRDLKPNNLNIKRASLGAFFDKMVLNIGSNTAEPNVFNDLALGIDARKSVLTIRNTVFRNIKAKIQPSPFGTNEFFAFGGMGIQAIEGSLDFKGKGGKAYNPAVFERVQQGIYSYYSDYKVDSANFYAPAEYAMQAIYGNGGDNHFARNYIKSDKRGLQLWKGGGSLAVLNNEVDCTGDTMQVDAVAIGSYYHSDIYWLNNNANIRIHDNILRGQNAKGVAMLSIGTAQQANIQRNHLEFNQYDKNFNDYNAGIKMTLLENSTIARNRIKGIVNDLNDYRNSATNVGILSINSRNNIVSCNRIDSARIGMQFQFNNAFGPYGLYGNAGMGNLGTGNLGGDTLSQYAIGLKIDRYALTGTQIHRGNVWKRTSGQYELDALMEDTTDARKTLNRFRVQDVDSLMPRQLNPTTDWFRVENNPSDRFICSSIPQPPMATNGSSTGIYETLLEGYQAPEAYVWMLEKQAYEEFSDLPVNLQTAVMQSFLSSKQGTEIATFYELKKGFETLFQQDALRAARLKVLIQFMDDWSQKKQLMEHQPIAEDALINDWSREYIDLSAAEKQSTLNKATALQQLNNTLPGDVNDFSVFSKNGGTTKVKPYLLYEKIINHFYLSKIIEGTTVYTDKEAAILKKIATMCPLIAGEAPMKARTIYQHFVSPIALPTADCENVGKYESVSAASRFKIFPNPTSSSFNLVSEDGVTAFDWILMSSAGVVLKEGKSSSSIETIDTHHLANGVYFVSIRNKGVIATTLKIIVLK